MIDLNSTLYKEFVKYIHYNHPDPDSIVMSMDKWFWMYKALKRRGAITGNVLYRYHKGSLDNSMETMRVVTSKKHLIEVVSHQMDQPCVSVEIKPYGYDDRIGWNTHIVLAMFESHQALFNTKNPIPVGYTNDDLDV
jgi:hypothetical protein